MQPEGLTTSYWPADRSQPLLELTVGEALRRAAGRAPQRAALVEAYPPGMVSLTGCAHTDRRWTYAELLDDAVLCAHWLLARFAAGGHVCAWAPNIPEWVILQYGAALAGMVLVTANPALRSEELRYVLEQSHAVALFHVDHFHSTDMAAVAHAACHDGLQAVSFSGWLTQVREAPAGGALPDVKPASAVQIQFTSGTTGHPQGALLHHLGLVTNASYIARRANLDQFVMLCTLPLFHTSGSVISVLGCCTTASTLVLAVTFDPVLVLATVERERVEFMGAVPTMLLALMEQQKRTPRDLHTLRLVVSGGAPVPEVLTQRVRAELGCDLTTVYGETEASPVICETAPVDTLVDKARTAGWPLWNVEVRIAHPVMHEPVPIGAEGEIQARGYQVMLGYYGQPEATRNAILPGGWLRTGDLGTMDARGYVRVTGRLKDMIIRGGENLYPVEIEAVLVRHPAVVDVSVFGLPDLQWGETVAAALRLRPEAGSVTSTALKAFCREHLAPQKTPTTWFVCDAFPLTGSGKIQKFRLREQALADRLARL
ncbi:MAG: long-chain fatty acid--CoA ligase [Nevskiaceae bacterium]|nr:MAG: long-chain fatty acid--CoA ligase [Nevskiaceae bacterium]TBR73059.1 MAG: long-chain fatty acid--CoA ligase [Nevskiaceae bacterium]